MRSTFLFARVLQQYSRPLPQRLDVAHVLLTLKDRISLCRGHCVAPSAVTAGHLPSHRQPHVPKQVPDVPASTSDA